LFNKAFTNFAITLLLWLYCDGIRGWHRLVIAMENAVFKARFGADLNELLLAQLFNPNFVASEMLAGIAWRE